MENKNNVIAVESNKKEIEFINKSINLIKDRKFDNWKARELLIELKIGGIEDED